MTETVLGRGLDALLPRTEMREEVQRSFRVDDLRPDPEQPRRRFAEEPMEELTASVSEHGVLQPILVRRADDGGYVIVAGERRWRAAQQAGLETVPAVVVAGTAASPLTLALIENLQREDLNPIEAALGFQRLTEQGYTHAEIGQRLGKSRTAVANALRLLQLPDEARALVELGALSEGQARAVLGAPPALHDELARRAAAESLTVREVEAVVRALAKPTREPAERKAAKLTPELETLAQAAERALQTRVAIRSKRGGGGGGQLIVDWQDIDQLRAWIAQLDGSQEAETEAPDHITV